MKRCIMKCVCGYKEIKDYDDSKNNTEKFLQLDGKFRYLHNNYHIPLYACPKCFTIRMEGE